MKIINCANCDMSFDLHSREKRKAGGLASHCVDCSEETVVKYAGVAAGEGKTANVSILKFKSVEDRKNYLSFWQANSGLHKSKSCQLSRGLKSTPDIKFETRAEFVSNRNHKGKA
jgi:hypothetical protein